jgi:hypothetical protein
MNQVQVFDKNQGFRVSERYKAVNTAQLVSHFENAGYTVASLKTSRVRNIEKQGYQKHLLRLRHPDLTLNALSGITPEIIVSNSYDGTSAFRLMMGVFRLVCSNGLIVGQTYESVRVVHVGDALNKVLNAAHRVQEQTEKIGHQIQAWSELELSDSQIESFAKHASKLILPDQDDANVIPIVRHQDLLRVRRSDDQGRDLWTVFNRIQENVLQGGLSYIRVSETGRVRNMTARRIQSIDRSIEVNRALWDLASQIETSGLITAA